MQLVLELAFVLLLFGAGLWLSAFFSGGETGFYRLSLPRVSIDAQAGDRVSQQLLWFARHPAYFVATTLVGNNLANYMTTFAISLFVVTAFGSVTELLDIGSTLVLSPIIFLFGELIPKNLYYRAPISLLRKDAALFRIFYYLFLPLSWPLVQATTLLERLNQQAGPRTNVMLGRSRLVQLMSQGRREGLLTEVQNRLACGVLQTAPQRVVDSMIPGDRVLGLDETATRDEMSQFARDFGTSILCLRRTGTDDDWFAYVRAVDLALETRPVGSLIRPMPVISASTSKLTALQQLQTAGALQGVIVKNGKTLGVVSTRGLVEQLFRPAVAPVM